MEYKVKFRDNLYKVTAKDDKDAANKIYTKLKDNKIKLNSYKVTYKDKAYKVKAISEKDAASKVVKNFKDREIDAKQSK